MPRVHHVKKARKDHPDIGVKKGEPYYWWGMMHGGRGVRHKSKTYPRPQQLTQSEFRISCMDVEDMLQQLEDPENLQDIIDAVQQIADECQEKYDNLPEGLQMGSSGELQEERRDAMEAWVSDLESYLDPEFGEGEEYEDLEAWKEAVQQCSGEY